MKRVCPVFNLRRVLVLVIVTLGVVARPPAASAEPTVATRIGPSQGFIR